MVDLGWDGLGGSLRCIAMALRLDSALAWRWFGIEGRMHSYSMMRMSGFRSWERHPDPTELPVQPSRRPDRSVS